MMHTSCQTMNQEQLLHHINLVSFMVNDLTLYLDTHPCDEEALSYFHKYSDLRNEALCAYADKFGPLTVDFNHSERKWEWADQPLPWEGGGC